LEWSSSARTARNAAVSACDHCGRRSRSRLAAEDFGVASAGGGSGGGGRVGKWGWWGGEGESSGERDPEEKRDEEEEERELEWISLTGWKESHSCGAHCVAGRP